MSLCTYNFDALIASYHLRKIPNIEPKDVKVDIEFGQYILNYTPSRLNLLHFCPNTSVTFESSAETIKEELSQTPLKITVKFKDAVVGEAQLPWPQQLVDGIGDTSDVLVHGTNAELKLNNEVVGCLEIILRLQALCGKCEFVEEQLEVEADNIGENIEAADIMFLMDDKQECGQKATTDAEPDGLKLNLSKFRDGNGKILLSPNMKDTCTSPQCTELKSLSNRFDKIVNSLVCVGIKDVRVNKKPTCGDPCSGYTDSCGQSKSCRHSDICSPCENSLNMNLASILKQGCSEKDDNTCVKNKCNRFLPSRNIQVIRNKNSGEFSIKCTQSVCGGKSCSSKPQKCENCKKKHNLPENWPRLGARVECHSMSMTPKAPKPGKCCPVCKDLIARCFNPAQNNDDFIHFCPPPPDPRNCRLCYADISWLPKNFPCPTCGDREKSCLKQEYKDALKMIRNLMKQN